MTPEQQAECAALWRTLLAASKVLWMPGMRAFDEDNACAFRLTEKRPDRVGDDSWIPDFCDPATVGCLLTQARDAWDLMLHAEFVSPGSWRVDLGGMWPQRPTGFTEAIAILRAIEAAP